jgi:hypothetical protein
MIVAVATCSAAFDALAANYDESVTGDVSNDPQAPMPWTLDLGPNSINGTAGGNFFANASDYDFVRFTIPPGEQLDSIMVDTYQNVDPFSQSFLGLQQGAPWLDGVGWDILGYWLYGWMHLESTSPGVNALDKMQENANADFQIPLPSGEYTLLIEDVDTVMTYKLTFNVSAVPEPAGLALVTISGLLGAGCLRKRPRSTLGA